MAGCTFLHLRERDTHTSAHKQLFGITTAKHTHTRAPSEYEIDSSEKKVCYQYIEFIKYASSYFMIVGYKPYNSDIRTRRERDAMCIHVLYAFPTILYLPYTIYKHSKHEPKSFSSFFCLKLRLHSFTHKQYEKCNIIIYERERAKKKEIKQRYG